MTVPTLALAVQQWPLPLPAAGVLGVACGATAGLATAAALAAARQRQRPGRFLSARTRLWAPGLDALAAGLATFVAAWLAHAMILARLAGVTDTTAGGLARLALAHAVPSLLVAGLTPFVVLVVWWMRRATRLERRHIRSGVAAGVCLALAIAAILPLLSVVVQVWQHGHKALSWTFLTQSPLSTAPPVGGIRHAIVGTAIVVALATAIGAPLGLLTGAYLAEAPRGGRVANAVRTVTDALSGTPSIVAGLFGYSVLVLTTHHFSAWAGATALSLLMLPTVARTTEEALRSVPDSHREGAMALGAPHWKTALRVLLPGAWPAIATGLLLAVARVAGETAPLVVTMVASDFLVTNPNAAAMSTLPQVIYDDSRSAQSQLRDWGWAAALVLITGVLVLNLVVRLVSRRRTHDA